MFTQVYSIVIDIVNHCDMLRVCRHSTFKNFHVNEAHMLATHGLSRADVEAVCYGDPAQLLVEGAHSGRYRVMGPWRDGKILVVILNPQGAGKFYPVTAKQPKRQELRRYNEWKAQQ